MPTIVTISGTSRPGNYTSRAVRAVNQELQRRGVTVESFDAQNMALTFPGQPETDDEKMLQRAVRSAHGVVLATPEYHGTFAAMTKLILENMGFPSAIKGKPMALLGVAQGRIGAIKSLEHLRGVCGHMGALVVPNTVSIAGVQQVFDDSDNVIDEGTREALELLVSSLLDFLKAYVCPKIELESIVRAESNARMTTVS